jgi:precorrin-8X/cobalt-precorrin-8 methylmutase
MAIEEMQVDAKPGPAVLLLGHGSRVKEANDILRKVAQEVKAGGAYGMVAPAFLQMERPDFREALEGIVREGFKEVIVMPYFLYAGAHVQEDLPREIKEAMAKYQGISLRVAPCLGFHAKLVDIALERIGAAKDNGPFLKDDMRQHPIEAQSLEIIGKELGPTGLEGQELEVLKRVIHTTADFEYRDILSFSRHAVRKGIEAIRDGSLIITDVKMVEAGITRNRLAGTGARVLCFSPDEDVALLAHEKGITRTAASMHKAMPFIKDSIVAIGNSPTALLELLGLVREYGIRPALIVGVPVGFVGAVEAKGQLMASDIDFISTMGRKGGSTVAAAIVNAIAIEAGRPVRP